MLWNALILGFLGSTHCLVMCGPLVMAIPGQKTFYRFFFSRFIYNMGRILIYAILGIVFGLLGRTILLASFQQTFSIIFGVLICSMSFVFFAQRIEGRISNFTRTITQPLKKLLSKHFERTSLITSLVSGMLNGILPCGLVYVALVSATSSFSVETSTLFMLVFGLGTFPAMLFMALLGKVSFTQFLFKISSVYVFCMGLLLILRGSGLDIPYLSPALEFIYPNMADPVICE